MPPVANSSQHHQHPYHHHQQQQQQQQQQPLPSSHNSNNHDSSYSMLFSPAASSLASTPGGGGLGTGGGGGGGNGLPCTTGGVELEVNWDPTMVRGELLQASAVLSHRGLKLASKWAAEQVMGIPVGYETAFGGPAGIGGTTTGGGGHHHHHNNNNNMDNDDQDDSIASTGGAIIPPTTIMHEMSIMRERDWYAKSLVDLGEYLHAASILSHQGHNQQQQQQQQPSTSLGKGSSGGTPTGQDTKASDITQMGPPQNGLSSYGFYIRAYALYMAGERRKEEEYVEMESEAQKQKGGPRNPYLPQLLEEVSVAYENNDLDAFGLYVYGLILKEARKESLICPHEPHVVLVECLLDFPYNWSAWLDLCEAVVGQDTSVEQQVEQALQPSLATHYMYHFFCAHLMAHHHQAYEDALVLFERLYEPLPDQPLFQSTYLKTQLAVVHYHLREMEQAQQWFQDALYQDRYSLDHKDVYSNILYVKEDRVGLSHLAHEAVVIDKYRPETCCIIGNYYSLKQNRQKAVLYFQRALKLDRAYTSAWTLMGHEYVELKQTEAAMEAYRRAVNVSPKDYRAWYGLGQTYEFLNMHLYALFYYRKAAMLRPYDSRMWCAVGQCFAALQKTRDAIRAYERAVAQEDTEGIATQKLAALYRQDGRQEEAAQCYLRHLELRYLVTCLSPATNPTLDDIVQGVVLEAVEAEAFLFLAQYHKSHHEYETAALLCSRLVEYPGPEKEQAKGLLRDLRSRGRRYTTRSTTTGGGGGATPGGSGTDGGGGGIVNTNTPFQFSP